MEKQEILDTLNGFIDQISVLKVDSGPKSNDFIKWVREVKQFIEKAFGSDYKQLREFKKIDYYPKKFDILSSESAFKKAWIDGLDQAESILKLLIKQTNGEDEESVEIESKSSKLEDVSETGVTEIDETETEHEIEAPVNKEEAQQPKTETKKAAPAKEPKELKKEVPAPIAEKPVAVVEKAVAEKKDRNTEKTVLLVNISDQTLNENIFKFVKRMGYTPVVVDQDVDGDVFMSDSLESATTEDTIFAIVLWKGDYECDGKMTPKPRVFFSTGFLTAKLSTKSVLILHASDLEVSDENYSGLNFLEIDDIQELMELKIAQEMDSAGLNIDFNFLKKKK